MENPEREPCLLPPAGSWPWRPPGQPPGPGYRPVGLSRPCLVGEDLRGSRSVFPGTRKPTLRTPHVHRTVSRNLHPTYTPRSPHFLCGVADDADTEPAPPKPRTRYHTAQGSGRVTGPFVPAVPGRPWPPCRPPWAYMPPVAVPAPPAAHPLTGRADGPLSPLHCAIFGAQI